MVIHSGDIGKNLEWKLKCFAFAKTTNTQFLKVRSANAASSKLEGQLSAGIAAVIGNAWGSGDNPSAF